MSKLINIKLDDYINEVDSISPAPGGGSVMGLVGSLACALAGMVGHLTINKKQFLQLSKEEQDSFNLSIEKVKNIKLELMNIVDKDAEGFNSFMKAMSMPKQNEEEKALRKKAMSDAALKASEAPFNTLKYCYELIEHFNIILKYGNNNVITDIASAYILIYAAAKGSILNININMPLIEDENILNDLKNNSIKYIDTIEKEYFSIQEKIHLFKLK